MLDCTHSCSLCDEYPLVRRLLPITLVVQVEQSVGFMCVSIYMTIIFELDDL